MYNNIEFKQKGWGEEKGATSSNQWHLSTPLHQVTDTVPTQDRTYTHVELFSQVQFMQNASSVKLNFEPYMHM
jgi:hypothetical protein